MARLSIFQKGLILVFVPFALNLIWIGLFWLSVQHCSRWVEAMGRNSQPVLTLSQSISALNRTWISGDQYLISGFAPAYKKEMTIEAHLLLDSLAELRRMTKDDALISKLTSELSTAFNDIGNKLEMLALRPDPLAIDYEKELPVARFYATMTDTTNILKAFGERDRVFQQSLQSEEIELARTRTIARTGLFLSIAIALMTAFLLQRDIVGRLLALNRKARSLAEKQLEIVSIGGDDELNELDRALSDADRELRDGAWFKRSFMHLMADNIQVPLSECLEDIRALNASEPVFKEKQFQRQIQALESSTINCTKLIDDMLLLENLDYGKLALTYGPTNVQSLVEATTDLLRALITRKNITVTNNVETETISADKGRIMQVLVNLLSNAIKFTPNDTVITIASHSDTNRLRITITDSGPGIDKKVRARLFQKFYQTAEGKKAGGTGLGLAISRLIIEAHDGLIGVDAGTSGGSVFWFELPKKAPLVVLSATT
ncbi:MAG: HAMP domain-containing histidine kinase [Cyanobacteria bacterium REEB67]|nr:HAMP domain-containing histidine kinase [Cyanobacteria bacterium REEB67]